VPERGHAWRGDAPPGGAAAGLSLRALVALMREDWETHDRALSDPGLQIVLLQRVGAWRLGLRPGLPRKSLSFVYRTLNWLLQNMYGTFIRDTTRLGRRVRIGHHNGILIQGEAVVGDGCLIRHNVTIGLATGAGGAPRLGRDVEVGVGAVVIGAVTIGDGARIGPNAVVLTDVAAGETAFAPPARRLHLRETEEHPEVDRPSLIGQDVEGLIGRIRLTLGIEEPLSAETPLISSGLVDSLNVAVLLDALEEAYSINISAEDVNAESFDTPSQILAVVQRQQR
jgi:serine O-acetyltransferase